MIELPYPAKALWPNGRAHWRTKAAQTKKHRAWAHAATLADNTRPAAPTGILATVYPKARGPLPDRDNTVSALKAYQDGIAQACKVDDRTFAAPRIQFGERTANGAVVIELVS